MRLFNVIFPAIQTRISIHAPRERCDTSSLISSEFGSSISIHAPRERCDKEMESYDNVPKISIHAPRERCDVNFGCDDLCLRRFQSTHRVSDATKSALTWIKKKQFQSTHRVSDATLRVWVDVGDQTFQSTHRVSDATSAPK